MMASNHCYAVDYQNHWAENEIKELTEENILVISGDEFFPDNDATVNQICDAFNHLLGFEQTDAEEDALQVSQQNGLFLNVKDINACMSRQEMAIIVNEILDTEIDIDAQTTFEDDALIQPWAKGYVAKLQEMNIFIGYPDGLFMPENHITKAELAMVLYRCQDYLATEVTISKEENVSKLEIGFFKYENDSLIISPIEDSLELNVGDTVMLSVSYDAEDWEDHLVVVVDEEGIIEFDEELLKLDALQAGETKMKFFLDNQEEEVSFEVLVK